MARGKAYRKTEAAIVEARKSEEFELDLSSKNLSELPASLAQLTKLKSLDLSFNNLTTLPEWLFKLTDLRFLNLFNNHLETLPESMGKLSELLELNLASNNLKVVPESLGKLTQVGTLNLFNNNLETLPESIGKLTSLELLYLFTNNLTLLPESLGNLRQLQDLDLAHNQLVVLPESLGKLTMLRDLRISDNQLTSLPGSMGNLNQLQELDLHNNNLTGLPGSLVQLIGLANIDLKGNPLNPELAAAYKEGYETVQRYLRAQEEAQVVLNEAKLILVGEGEVGKSCLLGALRNDPWEENKPTTHGIEIKLVELLDRETGTEITLNGWDFGGQRVYRPTHQLFFSAPAVYLVVWKPREGPQQGFVKEWIKLVKHREPSAKILVIATHGGPQQRQPDIDRQELWDLFGKETVVDFLFVDSKPDANGNRKGIEELKLAIVRLASKLPEMGRSVPKSFQVLREDLRARNKPYISLGELLDRGRAHKMDTGIAELFITISHRLGHLTHYQHDPLLRDIVILRPDWLATAISYIFDDDITRSAHGLVKSTRLAQLWDDPNRPSDNRYPAILHPVFLRLMERFDLSYRVADSTLRSESDTQSLVAQLVPDNRPKNFENAWASSPTVNDIQQTQICRIVDDKDDTATAEGLFYQLIVRLHKYSLGRVNYHESVHWKRGLVLDDDYNGRALLENKGNDVHITVRAPYPEFFLAMLTREVKYLVESFWEGLCCHVMVPCVEPCGANSPGTGLYEVGKLIKSKGKGRPEYPCPVCNHWQDIDHLLRNAPITKLLNDKEIRVELQTVRSTREYLTKPGPQVFLSYVSQNVDVANRIFDELSSRNIKVWFDRHSLTPGDHWKQAIRAAIKQGGFFIACFSQQYHSRTSTYMNEELTLAIEELRRRSTDKNWFIPVKIDDCSIPDREIGGGETIQDIQHIDLFQNWAHGIIKLTETIFAEDNIEETELQPEIQLASDHVSQAFLKAGLSHFSVLNSNLKGLLSRVDDGFETMQHILKDQAKVGPRLFSLIPADRTNFDPLEWDRAKFRLTLWCEHSRLPLPLLNGSDRNEGIYEIELERKWFVKAGQYLKLLTGTLSLVLPLASSAIKLKIDDSAYKAIEEQLDYSKSIINATIGETSKFDKIFGAPESSTVEHRVEIQGAKTSLRELHTLLKALDTSFGGLIRVINRRQEFLWVHKQFETEY